MVRVSTNWSPVRSVDSWKTYTQQIEEWGGKFVQDVVDLRKKVV